MGLSRIRLGDFIEQVTETNDGSFTVNDVYGMTITKEFIPTKANVKETNLSNFIVVRPADFVYNPRTHGKHIGFGYNNTERPLLISRNNGAFRIRSDKLGELDSLYLFMHFNRDEWDRWACFSSWGSSTEVFTWDALCDMSLDLPPIEVQQKYVAIYKAMLANQRVYEKGLADLKLSCDALVERLIREVPHETIAPYIEQSDARNTQGIGVSHVRGLSINKHLIETKASLDGVNLSNYKVIQPYELTYVPVTSRNGNKLSIAMNESDDVFITSAINTVFHIKADAIDKLLPGYLMLFFGRAEFDRYARFSSWGSARETFDWSEMCDVRIPIPDILVQRYAVALYDTWRMRTKINERLKSGLKEICPILIRGSIEEASL